MAGTDGASTIDVGLHYADGSRDERVAPCPDWFDDLPERPWTGEAERLSCPLRGMDRVRGEVFEERNGAALFDALIDADERKELAASSLQAQRGVGKPGRTRAYVFAVTGVAVNWE